MTQPTMQEAYERAFRNLLWRFRPPRLQRGIEFLLKQCIGNADWSNPMIDRVQATYQRLRVQAIRHAVRHAERSYSGTGSAKTARRRLSALTESLEQAIPLKPTPGSADFHCDSGLGGVARWLRASGYDARFWQDIEDEHLIRETAGTTAILLTTDRPLMERGVIKWNVIPSLLVPLSLGKLGQFHFIRQCLALPRKSPRCMTCGGELSAVGKELVRDRIPPRTYPWLDEYYECDRCGKLFWAGTHWRNVEQQLERSPAE